MPEQIIVPSYPTCQICQERDAKYNAIRKEGPGGTWWDMCHTCWRKEREPFKHYYEYVLGKVDDNW